MLQSCTKFRVFNFLLAVSVINVVLYRTFFVNPVTPLFRVTPGYRRDVNITSNSSSTLVSRIFSNSWGNVTSASGVENATAEIASAENNTTAGVNVSVGGGGDVQERLAPVWGPAKPLQSWGKLVIPRANVTAPWAVDNTTTLCPLVPPKLVGPLATYRDAPSVEEIVKLNPGLEPGGHFHPPDCRARSRVAIIVPYRDRDAHLRILLHNLHPMLQRQQLDYVIVVVELAQPTHFNRAMLLNIGAVESMGLWDVQCFIFHDVDLVPENDRNLYTCPESPRHMSAAVDKFGYKLPYTSLFGGVTALNREHFYKINGYPNKYFGWGGEDDDLSARVSDSGLKVIRYSMDIARYRMIKHERDSKNEPNPKRFEMVSTWKKRQATDGLNTLQYTVEKVEFRPAYTWIHVKIDMAAVLKS